MTGVNMAFPIDAHGLCSKDSGSSKTGVKLESKAGLELDLNFEEGKDRNVVKSVNLFVRCTNFLPNFTQKFTSC